MSLLVAGRDGTGSGLSDDEVRDQAVTLIAAGYETTSAAMGWAIHALARHPQWQQQARDEATHVAAAPSLSTRDLSALKVLPAIVDETLRLYPPAAILARYVQVPFSFGGRDVRRGDLVILSPYVTHRDGAVFAEPTRFDPGRWLGRPRPGPERFLPFGGGAHRCIGSHLATTKLVVMLSELVAAGPFGPSGPRPRVRSLTAMRPTHARIVRI